MTNKLDLKAQLPRFQFQRYQEQSTEQEFHLFQNIPVLDHTKESALLTTQLQHALLFKVVLPSNFILRFKFVIFSYKCNVFNIT